jgi:phosphomannomutase/phosphoglucomutase
MNPEMFREYDIRGIAGKDMTEDDVLLIGKGVGTFLVQHGRLKLNVGRDCRLTSDAYMHIPKKSLKDLCQQGVM